MMQYRVSTVRPTRRHYTPPGLPAAAFQGDIAARCRRQIHFFVPGRLLVAAPFLAGDYRGTRALEAF